MSDQLRQNAYMDAAALETLASYAKQMIGQPMNDEYSLIKAREAVEYAREALQRIAVCLELEGTEV